MTPEDAPLDSPIGSRMSYWIATTLRDRRLEAAVSVTDLATALGVNWRTIHRLEGGRSMGRDIDKFVAGYAYVLGIGDPRDLWADAAANWFRHGSAPQHEPTAGPAAVFADAIRSEALRRIAEGQRAPRSRRRATR